MSSAAGQKPVRKFPPPCWTRDEALVLIEAYRERWHALNRAFLRTTDWDAVAETVTTSFPDVTPPKTSAQCRHKMEKLRQRHRVEKQRAAAFSGESFLSTWFYYEAMEAVENGSNTLPDNNPGHEIGVKPLPIQNSTKRRTKPNPNFTPNVSIRYQGNEYEDRSLVEAPIEETLIPIAYRNPNSNTHLGETLIRQPKHHKLESGRTGLRPRKFSKVVDDDEYEESSERWMKVPKVPNNTNLLRAKWGNEKKAKAKAKLKGKGNNNNNNNNNNGGVADVVRSIKLLGDGFMKVEKMKMDAVREIEEMRMETEMKRNELMMESQKRIVDAFVKGLIEARKVSTTMGNM